MPHNYEDKNDFYPKDGAAADKLTLFDEDDPADDNDDADASRDNFYWIDQQGGRWRDAGGSGSDRCTCVL